MPIVEVSGAAGKGPHDATNRIAVRLSTVPVTMPQPMLARLADKLPVGPQWSYEIK